MQVFRLVQPEDAHHYALAGRRGTWAPNPGPRVCPQCGASRQERVPPLLIMWEPGSDVIGDFTWPGFNDDVVVSDRVRRALEAEFGGVAFHPVEMLEPRLRPRPAGARPRTQPRVAVPYSGPPLWDLQPTNWCGVDQEASGVRVIGECATCGRVLWEAENWARPIVVDGRTWQGTDVFRLDAYPSGALCTERLKAFLEQQGFTNIAFELRGEIGDAAATTGPVGPHLARAIEIGVDEAGAAAPGPSSQEASDARTDLDDREIARLPDDSPSACPVDMQDVIEYLALEIPDEEISADDQEFVRTAEIDGWHCWLWRFVDLYGEDPYASVSLRPDRSTCVMYDPAYARTPEQFIWDDYARYRRDP